MSLRKVSALLLIITLFVSCRPSRLGAMHQGFCKTIQLPVGARHISVGNGKIVVARSCGAITVWDQKTGKEVTPQQMVKRNKSVLSFLWNLIVYDNDNYITSVFLAGNKIVCGYSIGDIKIWDLMTGRDITKRKMNHPVRRFRGIVLSVSGDKIVSGSQEEGSVKIWNLNSGKESTLREMKHGSSVQSIYVYDDRKIISRSSDDTISVWDLKTCEKNALQGGEEGFNNDVFSACVYDGKIISGLRDGTIKVRNLKTGQKIILQKEMKHNATVSAICAHDGKIISGAADGTIKIWDLKTGNEIIAPIMDHGAPVCSVAVSGGQIISFSTNGTVATVKIWDTSSLLELENKKEQKKNLFQNLQEKDEEKVKDDVLFFYKSE